MDHLHLSSNIPLMLDQLYIQSISTSLSNNHYIIMTSSKHLNFHTLGPLMSWPGEFLVLSLVDFEDFPAFLEKWQDGNMSKIDTGREGDVCRLTHFLVIVLTISIEGERERDGKGGGMRTSVNSNRCAVKFVIQMQSPPHYAYNTL